MDSVCFGWAVTGAPQSERSPKTESAKGKVLNPGICRERRTLQSQGRQWTPRRYRNGRLESDSSHPQAQLNTSTVLRKAPQSLQAPATSRDPQGGGIAVVIPIQLRALLRPWGGDQETSSHIRGEVGKVKVAADVGWKLPGEEKFWHSAHQQ